MQYTPQYCCTCEYFINKLTTKSVKKINKQFIRQLEKSRGTKIFFGTVFSIEFFELNTIPKKCSGGFLKVLKNRLVDQKSRLSEK
ncbi:MAG: hypothetical protein DRI89_00205 [Bacteroidetes bacterium]|nr:MAG: hypothetical protein DRI89_00205 [Bacteroidota bacterium]